MNIKHKNIIISPEDPFFHCKLGRAKYARTLTSIVKTNGSGFVLAINNDWGSGKTTFVRMWEQELKNKKFRTLYFNAWENDFEPNPQTAILAELQCLFDSKNKKQFEPLLRKGAIVAKNVIPSLLKGLLKRYTDEEILFEGIEKSADAAMEILKEEIDNYSKRKKGIEDFRKELEQVVNANGGLPLIFIIDELDRCRPNYAVETLEQIKHLFSVPGIVFVLSIAKNQLGHAIRGVYGSEQMDVEEYLRRFIDVEFSIPAPQSQEVADYLIEYFDFASFFNKPERMKFQELKNDLEILKETMTYFLESKRMTLRQAEKFLAHARIGVDGFDDKHYLFPSGYLFLLFIKVNDHSFYQDIKSMVLPPQQVYEQLQSFVGQPKESFERLIWHGQAILIFIYFHGYREDFPNVKLYSASSNSFVEEIDLMIGSEDKMKTFKHFFTAFIKAGFQSIRLEHFTSRIDLIYDVLDVTED